MDNVRSGGKEDWGKFCLGSINTIKSPWQLSRLLRTVDSDHRSISNVRMRQKNAFQFRWGNYGPLEMVSSMNHNQYNFPTLKTLQIIQPGNRKADKAPNTLYLMSSFRLSTM